MDKETKVEILPTFHNDSWISGNCRRTKRQEFGGDAKRDTMSEIIQEAGLYCKVALAKETRNRIWFGSRIVLRFCNGKRDLLPNIILKTNYIESLPWQKRHEIEYNSGNWIVLEKLHRQQRLGINFNWRNQIVFELASAKETQNRIQFENWIALRFCNGKRDSATDIICKTKLYSALQWQKRPDD